MIKYRRNFLWIVPLVLLLSYPLWKPLAAGFLKPEPKTAVHRSPALRDQTIPAGAEMDGVELEQSRDGRREWSLTAERLYRLENESRMSMENVRALFYDAAGKTEETRVRSEKAKYDDGKQLLILQGKVVVQNLQGYEMQTESLEYLGADKKIRTTSAARVEGKNIRVSGRRLLYDVATGNYRVEGNVVFRVW